MKPTVPDKLGETELRSFGLIMAFVIACFFGLILPWLFNLSLPYWPWVLAILFVITGLVAPHLLQPVFYLWMKFGLFMNRIMVPLVLGIFYYMIITPIALYMRIIGRDIVGKHMNPHIDTYRVKSFKRSKESMERPF